MKKTLFYTALLAIGLSMLIASLLPYNLGLSRIFLIVVGFLITAISVQFIVDLLRTYSTAVTEYNLATEQSKVDPDYLGLSPLELWTKVLEKLNVTLRPDEDLKNRYFFDFQGGHFFVLIDDSAFNEIYYTFIDEIELSDIDEVSLVRRAINEANFNACPTIVYDTDVENDKMHVHMLQSVFLVPQIPHLTDYVESRLVAFFHLQRRFSEITEKMRKNS